jgi:hypothetical protein
MAERNTDDLRLDERFDRFEAQVRETFRPAPLADLAVRACSRRRLRRGLLAGILAALVAAPAGGFAVAAGQRDAVPPPVPPVPQNGFHPIERQVALPGVRLPLVWVRFGTDARHGWAWFEECTDQDDYGTCRYALGSTQDGGGTWRPAILPDLPADRVPMNVYPLDAGTLAIHAVQKRFWLTTDQGRTFQEHPVSAPPADALRASTDPEPGDPYTLLCPGAVGFEDGASGVECARPQLVRIGDGPVADQPTAGDELLQVLTGSDGRVWLLTTENGRSQIAVSTDDARTWTKLAPVAGASDTRRSLTISPDGQEVWLVDEQELWRLSGTRFVPQTGLPAVFVHNVKAVGGGVLAVAAGQDEADTTPGFWLAGAFHPIDGMSVVAVDVVRDGSVMFVQTDGRRVLGVGAGTDRIWYRFS